MSLPAACGRWHSARTIDRDSASRPLRRTLLILPLILLLGGCGDSTAPQDPGTALPDQANIYVTSKGRDRKLVEVRIAPDTAVVAPGNSTAFAASGVYSDGRSKLIMVSWTVTGGTIDSAGLFTADSTEGVYQVIGTEHATGLADTATVIGQSTSTQPPTVGTPPTDAPPAPVVSQILISPASASLEVGDSIQLVAIAKDANGATLGGVDLTWTSSNSGVAKVSSTGMVKAVAGGSTVVTAAAQGITGSASLSVVTPTPVPTPAGDCSDFPYTRLVPVSTASQLTAAITNARPGDLIQLAPGTYSGRWTLSTSGSAASRILLCGPRSAIFDGGGTSPAPITLAIRASNWTLQGFTIRNAFQPIFLIGAHGVIVKGLEIYNIGQEAIHLHTFSSHNLIDSNYVHDTGKAAPQYGEGIYVGSANTKWCTYYNCEPDKTDSNTISRNTIGPNIGAQMVDVKEGTTGTIVSGNIFNGSGGSTHQDAWINVYGNKSVVSGNSGTTAQLHAVKVEMLVSGWGAYNVFHNNTWDLSGGAGYGFRVGGGTPASTVDLGCDNNVLNADSGFATIPCEP